MEASALPREVGVVSRRQVPSRSSSLSLPLLRDCGELTALARYVFLS